MKLDSTQILKDYYGSHVQAAAVLGISPRHYRKARQEGFKNSLQLKRHVECLVGQIVMLKRQRKGLGNARSSN